MANENPRVLLFGSTGQVGAELATRLRRLGNLITPHRVDADLETPESLRAAIRATRPSVVVNAAAYTAVEQAEADEERALRVNAEAPRVIAEEAQAIGACILSFSTDFVFDGRHDAPYVETDATNPLSAYGRSKAAGEAAVAGVCPRHLLLRTSWVFGSHGSNFVKTILRIAAERETLRVICDQRGTPTSARLVAQATASVLEEMAASPEDDPRWGLYHLTASGETTWYDFACFIVTRAKELGMKLKATADDITAVPTSDYPSAATRPAYSVLDTHKIRAAFGLELPSWESEADAVLRELVKSRGWEG